MATLSPGIIQKLIDAMNSGKKLFREGRAALLQVIEILPVGLDDKDLWPKGGFHIKVSDSSQAIYTCLPANQDVLILSNKLRLGQFIQVDGFESGDSVPILQGINLFTGRHALVGSPELISKEEGDVKSPFSSDTAAAGGSSRQSNFVSKRSSWSSEQFNPTINAFSSKRSDISSNAPITITPTKRKGSKLPVAVVENELVNSPEKAKEEEIQEPSFTNIYQLGNASPMKCSSLAGVPLPEKFGNLGKETMEQRVTAQRVAHQALKDASLIETIVRSLKKFSCLATSAKSDAPASCFEQFLTFHDEITQTIEAMEATVKKNIEEDDQKSCKWMILRNSEIETSIELARKIKMEGGNWLMEFLEAVVEDLGTRFRSKKSGNYGCSYELFSKIIDWVEIRDDQKKNTDHIIKILRSNLVENSA